MLDAEYPALMENDGFPVVGTIDQLEEFRRTHSVGFAASGNPVERLNAIEMLDQAGFQVPILVHPASWVSPRAKLGAGTIVMAGAVVQTGAVIGLGGIINTGASVDHDCRLGDGVHLAPGARLAGGVEIGDRSWIGLGAVIKEYISIGTGATIGAGATVIRDVADYDTVAGVPARSVGSIG
jgi:sugar O-acyltransferase (sialic acid O-acetyltransferase NeuD family)